MSHLPALITDLAIILASAGVMTLVFKRLKQPLVLGYIVAGIIAGPHFPLTPTVMDSGNIQTWADIGVVFLLFALGLEFSFKKLMKVGGPAIIAALTIIFGMVMLGYLVGIAMGWKQMDSIFLGGMLSMSSTSIIYKAFEDLGLRTQRFTGLVLGILVIEDLVAIVLMVVLSTMAVSQNFEGVEMFYSIGKLMFFLLLWFLTGIYIIPTFFRRTRLLMGDETMLIVSLGLCLLMVAFATYVGFSSALGAFVMGSILAETVEAETIERLVRPVKDLFAAIFFVSVGMMVDPNMIIQYIVPIVIIILTVVIGQSTFGTCGVMLAGQPLKTALQSGFCLTQIGEFAFIIAGLGTSMGVTSNFLYPIVVAVSVITTFLTPYMIRAAGPAYPFVDRHLPRKWKRILEHYSLGTRTVNHESNWKSLLTSLIRITVIYSVIIIAILIVALNILVPLVKAHFPGNWGSLLCAVAILLLMAPFLRAIVAKKNHSAEFQSLWADGNFNRAYLVSLVVFRFVLVIVYIMIVMMSLFKASIAILLGVACVVTALIFYSRYLKKQSIQIERNFLRNFRVREMYARRAGAKVPPRFAGHLLSRDLHLSDFVIPAESLWAGKTLAELQLATRFDIMVVAIFRGQACLNIPGGKERIYPQDRIQVIGSDEQLERFGTTLQSMTIPPSDTDLTQSEMCLKQFIVTKDSLYNGKSIRESGIRDVHHCVVVGVERGKSSLRNPDADTVFQEGDWVWVVGEETDVRHLFNA
ncbi:MAG: cation:proton antiporter [Odoribacter sp.]|nr:cation:proton antiporter [Odoribacter sp.]